MRSHVAPRVEVPGDKIKTQKFLGPSDQNRLYHTSLLSKIWVLTKNKKIVNDPFNSKKGNHRIRVQIYFHPTHPIHPSKYKDKDTDKDIDKDKDKDKDKDIDTEKEN